MMLVSYKTIGRNIRAARTRMKKTQEQVAEQLLITPLHFGRLERGERPASLEQIAQIACVLGVSTASLLNGCINGESFGAMSDKNASSLGKAIEQLANGCSPSARCLMYTLCQSIASHDKFSQI